MTTQVETTANTSVTDTSTDERSTDERLEELPLANLPKVSSADNSVNSVDIDAIAEVKRSAHGLVEALQGLAKAEVQSAVDMTQEAFHNFEQAVKSLRDKADLSIHTATHEVEDFDSRLVKAAKAAWKELSSRPSDSDSAS
jgi:hypothetical protein